MSERDFPLSGKVVVAHPSRVAQADQIAAAEEAGRVELREFCSTEYAYILDLDELTKLPAYLTRKDAA